MYQFLLCVRYLRTRYIALASIISVMLGVATMIVVNSVMSGFATEMRDRINANLSDLTIDTVSYDGEYGSQAHMELARQVAGDYIEAMTTTVQVFGLMHFQRGGQWIPRPVELVGIEPESKSKVGPFVEHLDSYKTIREDGIVVREPLRAMSVKPSWELTVEAMAYRQERQRRLEEYQRYYLNQQREEKPLMPPDKPVFEEDAADVVDQKEAAIQPVKGEIGPSNIIHAGAVQAEPAAPDRVADDPFNGKQFGNGEQFGRQIDVPGMKRLEGFVYIGAGLIEGIIEDPKTGKTQVRRAVVPGDVIKITTVSAGQPPKPVSFVATVVDIYKSGMSEYDSNLVFCNLEKLQEVRGMIDPTNKEKAITSIQIKLKNYNDAPKVVSLLENVFPAHQYSVRTWEQKQGPLLAAVDIESAILNVLLFMIIAVAGFGILAIFFMIVVEKTRDIGILKALGASSRGVMSIFLLYGLALGCVGSGVGVGCGLLFVRYINEIEAFLAFLIGRKVFDERIYYFPTIPTSVNPMTVIWVAIGAILIAVTASILPARRAARLHPVEALRYE